MLELVVVVSTLVVASVLTYFVFLRVSKKPSTPESPFIFSIDVEGAFYGEHFAVGVSVIDRLTKKEVDQLYLYCPWKKEYGRNDRDHKFMLDHVVPAQGDINCQNPKEMRDKFWIFWKKYRSLSDVVTDCGYPIEANFFRCCILDDEENRSDLGPYPLHEVATRLLCLGKDPTATYPRLPGEHIIHHPLHDARQSGRLFLEN